MLGSLLRDPDKLIDVIPLLPSKAFHSPEHRGIYSAMKAISADGLEVEPFTLAKRLEIPLDADNDKMKKIIRILDDTMTGANLMHYVGIVLEKWRLRGLAYAATDLYMMAMGSKSPPEVLLSTAEKKIAELQLNGTAIEAVPVSDLVTPVLGAISDRKSGGMPGVKTWLYDLDDKLMGGFHPGELIIIAARPSMGKTSLAMNIAENASRNVPVVVCSMEQSSDELVERMLSSEARVDSRLLKCGRYSDEETVRLVEACETVGRRQLFIADVPGKSMPELISVIRRAVHKFKAEMVVFDYLQLISSTDPRQNRQEAVSDFSRKFKGIARDLKIPVVVLSQLNRESEKRADKRPMLSDLRESGAIEQDADVILLLHRPDYYDKNDKPGVAELNIAKQRNGPTGAVTLTFDKSLTKFLSYASEMKSFHEMAREDF